MTQPEGCQGKGWGWAPSWQQWEAAIPHRAGAEWDVRCFLLRGRGVLLTGEVW